jgi:membrane-associated phospholipid phosphatase
MRLIIVLISFVAPLALKAQYDSTRFSVYKTNPKLEIPIPMAFFVGSYFGFKALDKYASITEEDVLKLNPETINSFDRPVAYYNPANFEGAQQTSNVLLDVALVSPVFLLLDKKIRKDWKDILSLFLVTHAIDNVIYFSSGTAVWRPRPLTYNPAVPLSEKIGEGKSNSFFSGHTSWSATSTFFLVKIYTDYHQVKGFKRLLLYTGAAVPPAVVGYYRMEAGKHFKTDVITGLLVGALCGITVPELHRVKSKIENFTVSPFMMRGANGISLTYKIK